MGLREANKACELVNTEPGDCSQVVRMFKKVSEPWLHKRFFEHMNKLWTAQPVTCSSLALCCCISNFNAMGDTCQVFGASGLANELPILCYRRSSASRAALPFPISCRGVLFRQLQPKLVSLALQECSPSHSQSDLVSSALSGRMCLHIESSSLYWPSERNDGQIFFPDHRVPSEADERLLCFVALCRIFDCTPRWT